MNRTTGSVALVAVLGGAVLLAAAEATKAKEDDLALVKRAVAQQTVAQNEPARPAAHPRVEAMPAPRTVAPGREPQWFKVRVVDKATGKRKVTINLPLTLVKAMGDDVPIDWPCSGLDSKVRSNVKLSQLLATLEAGQDLVQVDDEDSEVRVWVE
jgi:hypothetical protein